MLRNPAGPTFKDLFFKMSHLLNHLASDIQAIECEITYFTGQNQQFSNQTIVRLQNLDILRQTLEDLSTLTNLLSNRGEVDGVSFIKPYPDTTKLQL
jgi:hypothetical protein